MVVKKIRPTVKLTPEMKKELEKAGADIVRAESSIESIEKLGLDATELRDKIQWAKNARKVLLEEFA